MVKAAFRRIIANWSLHFSSIALEASSVLVQFLVPQQWRWKVFSSVGGQTNLQGPLNRRGPLGAEGPPETNEGALVNDGP